MKKAGYVALALVVILGVLLLALPTIVERYVSKTLAEMEDYRGTIEGIDIQLIAGQYTVEGLELNKRSTPEIDVPFLAIDAVELGLQWSALLRGEIVADVVVNKPVVNFVDGESEEDSQVGAGPDWVEKIEALTPFTINAFEIHDGAVRLRSAPDDEKEKQVLSMDQIELTAKNFSNVRDSEKELPATLDLKARVQDAAPLTLHADLDPLEKLPKLNVDVTLDALPLTALNDLLKRYANVDAETGTFEAYIEIASADGAFTGYAKALAKDADFFNIDEKGTFFGKAWDAVVDTARAVFENNNTDRVGARVPLAGELDAVDVELIPAVFSVLQNAFIQALSVGLGNSITIEDAEQADTEQKDTEQKDTEQKDAG